MVLADLVAFHTLTGQVCFSTESRPHNVICLPSVRCQNRTSRAHPIPSEKLGPFCPTREAITREGAATRTVSVAAAALLPAAFALEAGASAWVSVSRRKAARERQMRRLQPQLAPQDTPPSASCWRRFHRRITMRPRSRRSRRDGGLRSRLETRASIATSAA